MTAARESYRVTVTKGSNITNTSGTGWYNKGARVTLSATKPNNVTATSYTYSRTGSTAVPSTSYVGDTRYYVDTSYGTPVWKSGSTTLATNASYTIASLTGPMNVTVSSIKTTTSTRGKQTYKQTSAGYSGNVAADYITSMTITYCATDDDNNIVRFHGVYLTPGQTASNGGFTAACNTGSCGISGPRSAQTPYVAFDHCHFDGVTAVITGHNNATGQDLSITVPEQPAQFSSFTWYPSQVTGYVSIPATYGWN